MARSTLPGLPCRACATPAELAGQSWCLECGAPLGAPRVRARRAAAILGGTLVIGLGGGGLAFGQLREQATAAAGTLTASPVEQAAAPAPTDTAQVSLPGVTPPGTTSVPGTAVATKGTGGAGFVHLASKGKKAATTAGSHKGSSDDTASATPAPSSSGSSSTPAPTVDDSGTTGGTTGTASKPKPVPQTAHLSLAAANATLYPHGVTGWTASNPLKAIDGDPDTFWTAQQDDDAAGGIGFVVDLNQPLTVRRVVIRSRGGAFGLRVASASGSAVPASADDAGWDTAFSGRASGTTTVSLPGGRSAESWLIYVPSSPGATISEVEFYGTPLRGG